MAVQNVASPASASAGGTGATARAAGRRPSTAALVVVALTVAGAIVRVIVGRQSVFADELSTYWISATHSLGGVLSLLYSTGRIHHAEITPPLSFLASWLTTRLGKTPELLRLPALLAGTATIPLVYLLGLRTSVGAAALLAAALTALSPFMIYYSAEARAYGLLMFFVALSTLSLLLALDTGRRALVGAVRGVRGGRVLHPLHVPVRARGPARLGPVGAARGAARRADRERRRGRARAAVDPRADPGPALADRQDPLGAVGVHANAIRLDLQHWGLGYPYTVAGGLRDLPGTPALVLLAIAGALAVGGAAWRARADRRRLPRLDSRMCWSLRRCSRPRSGRRSPARSAITSSGSGTWPPRGRTWRCRRRRSWPPPGPRWATAAALVAVVAFALGAEKMLEPRFSRPNFQGPADFIAAHARPGDVVVDGTGALSPGPTTPLDVTLHTRIPVVRALAPAERTYPFNFLTPSVPIATAFGRAIATARGGDIFVVSVRLAANPTGPTLTPPALPGGYVRCSQRRYEGFVLTLVTDYARACGT